MKIVLSCVCVVGLCSLLYINNSKVEIKYYTNSIDAAVIHKSLQQINSTKIIYTKVNSEKEANLIINTSNNLSVSNRYGETNWRGILINEQFKLTSLELVNLISHEFGHYLFLRHNTSPCSIMNDTISLKEKYVTKEDRDSLTYLKYRVITANLLSNLKEFVDNIND